MTTTATTISTEQDVMTLINVFTLSSEHQQELIDILAEATTVMVDQPGFISANLHRSIDGQRVVNYVEWATKEDYDAMLANPRAMTHVKPRVW